MTPRNKRKIVLLDEETDTALGNICDAALKAKGIQLISSINILVSSIKEEEISLEN